MTIRCKKNLPPCPAALTHLGIPLSNREAFPFVLGGWAPFADALLPDDALLADVGEAVARHRAFFAQLPPNVTAGLVSDVTQCAPACARGVRALLLVWVFVPALAGPPLWRGAARVMFRTVNLPAVPSGAFYGALRRLPRHLRRIVPLVHAAIHEGIHARGQLAQRDFHESLVPAAQFLWQLKEWASDPSESPLPSSAFWNEEYTRTLDVTPATFSREWRLWQFPAILTLAFKSRVLQARFTHQQRAESSRALFGQRFDPTIMVDQEAFMRSASFNLTVRRSHVVQDTINSLLRAPQDHLGRRLMVTFQGEEALDAGGVGREFFHLLTSQLFSPDYGMFAVVNGNHYWFTPTRVEELDVYTMLGTVVALAAYNHILLTIRFPLLLYKKLLGKTIGLNDLEELDTERVRGLRDLLKMKERGEDVASVMLTFTVMVENFGANDLVELVPNGSNLDVSNDNVEKYVYESVQWYAHRSVQSQFEAFQRGFNRLFAQSRIEMFAPDELDLLLSGEEVLEWAELRKNAKYIDGYRSNSPAVRYFWDVFNDLSNEDKVKFLQLRLDDFTSPHRSSSKTTATASPIPSPASQSFLLAYFHPNLTDPITDCTALLDHLQQLRAVSVELRIDWHLSEDGRYSSLCEYRPCLLVFREYYCRNDYLCCQLISSAQHTRDAIDESANPRHPCQAPVFLREHDRRVSHDDVRRLECPREI
jgi:hypothetical protein